MKVLNVLHKNHLRTEKNVRKKRKEKMIKIGETIARQTQVVTRKKMKRIGKKVKKRNGRRREKEEKGQKIRKRI